MGSVKTFDKTVTRLTPQKKRLGNIAPAINADEAVNKAQLDTAINSTLEGNNNTFTGNNTHSGTETFTNTTGVITDTITPNTSGAGTSYLRPAGVKTTTPIAASAIKTGGVYGLSKADGLAVTLPAAATATIGSNFRFHILTSCTSVGYVFSTGEAGDVFVGMLWCSIANPDAANDMEMNLASGTVNTLTLGATTACGLAGGWVEFTCISATQWAVSGVVLGSGTLASNLFTTA
jgi:hypothetical protein